MWAGSLQKQDEPQPNEQRLLNSGVHQSWSYLEVQESRAHHCNSPAAVCSEAPPPFNNETLVNIMQLGSCLQSGGPWLYWPIFTKIKNKNRSFQSWDNTLAVSYLPQQRVSPLFANVPRVRLAARPAVHSTLSSSRSVLGCRCWLSHADPCEAFAGAHSSSRQRQEGETSAALSWSGQHSLFWVRVRLSDPANVLSHSLITAVSFHCSWQSTYATAEWQRCPLPHPLVFLRLCRRHPSYLMFALDKWKQSQCTWRCGCVYTCTVTKNKCWASKSSHCCGQWQWCFSDATSW